MVRSATEQVGERNCEEACCLIIKTVLIPSSHEMPESYIYDACCKGENKRIEYKLSQDKIKGGWQRKECPFCGHKLK